MFQSQQELHQSSFTYFPQSTDSLLPFSQPTNFPPQPLLFPPGTDPFAHSGQPSLTNVNFEAQAQYYVDPNASSQSWVSTQADPIKYDATSLVANLNSSSDNNWMSQSLANNVIGSTANQNNLQVNIIPTAATFPGTSNTIDNVSTVGQASSVVGQTIFETSGVVNAQELEIKKQKLLNAGAPVDSVVMCNICNVACNSPEAFRKHLYGRRHAAQAGLIAANGIGPYLAAIRANDHFWNKGKKTVTANQSIWCELCKVHCNCNDAYAKHLSGKKHLNNLEKLENAKNGTVSSSAPATPNMLTGPVENQAANNYSVVNKQKLEKRFMQPEATKEDLERKKRKVMEGGAAAAAVRVCTICNVVCNSQKVFSLHLTGQKHAAVVRKQVEASRTAL